MPRIPFTDLASSPEFKALPPEEQQTIASGYWDEVAAEQPDNAELFNGMREASKSLLDLKTKRNDAPPVQRRFLDSAVQTTAFDLSLADELAQGRMTKEGYQEALKVRAAELGEREAQLDKTRDMFSDDPKKQRALAIRLDGLEQTAITGGVFGKMPTYDALFATGPASKDAYEALRKQTAEDYGLEPDEVDALVKPRLGLVDKPVSLDPIGNPFIKPEIFAQGPEAVKQAILNSDIPWSKKQEMIGKDDLAERMAGYYKSTVEGVKTNHPEFAKLSGVDQDDNPENGFSLMLSALPKTGFEKFSSGVFTDTLSTAEQVVPAVTVEGGQIRAQAAVEGKSVEEGAAAVKAARDEARKPMTFARRAQESANQLSQEFYKNQGQLWGVDMSAFGSGAGNVLTGVALGAVTGGASLPMTSAKVATMGPTALRMINGANSVMKVSPTIGLAMAKTGTSTYENALKSGLSEEEAGELATLAGATEGVLTGVMSFLGAGGVEAVGEQLLGTTARQAVKESSKSFARTFGGKLTKGVAAEQFEEGLIAAFDSATVQARINPKMTSEDFLNTMRETALVTLAVSGPTIGVGSLRETLAEKATYQKTDDELELEADLNLADAATTQPGEANLPPGREGAADAAPDGGAVAPGASEPVAPGSPQPVVGPEPVAAEEVSGVQPAVAAEPAVENEGQTPVVGEPTPAAAAELPPSDAGTAAEGAVSAAVEDVPVPSDTPLQDSDVDQINEVLGTNLTPEQAERVQAEVATVSEEGTTEDERIEIARTVANRIQKEDAEEAPTETFREAEPNYDEVFETLRELEPATRRIDTDSPRFKELVDELKTKRVAEQAGALEQKKADVVEMRARVKKDRDDRNKERLKRNRERQKNRPLDEHRKKILELTLDPETGKSVNPDKEVDLRAWLRARGYDETIRKKGWLDSLVGPVGPKEKAKRERMNALRATLTPEVKEVLEAIYRKPEKGKEQIPVVEAFGNTTIGAAILQSKLRSAKWYRDQGLPVPGEYDMLKGKDIPGHIQSRVFSEKGLTPDVMAKSIAAQSEQDGGSLNPSVEDIWQAVLDLADGNVTTEEDAEAYYETLRQQSEDAQLAFADQQLEALQGDVQTVDIAEVRAGDKFSINGVEYEAVNVEADQRGRTEQFTLRGKGPLNGVRVDENFFAESVTPTEGSLSHIDPAEIEAIYIAQEFPEEFENTPAAEPLPYSPEALKEAFNATDEQAVAMDALVQAMGLDTSRIRLQRGGLPGDAAMRQEMDVRDAEYMAAVERGDTETAQRMVDEAARAAGYSTGPVWQGSPDDKGPVYKLGFYNSLIRDESETNQFGFFFSDSEEQADKYRARYRDQRGGTLRRVFLSGKILDLTEAGPMSAEEALPILTANKVKHKLDPDEYDFEHVWRIFYDHGKDLRKAIKKAGFDGVAFNEINGDRETVTTAVLDPNQIKSADPVTRDADGNVIPLSRRFNPESPSILYQGDTGYVTGDTFTSSVQSVRPGQPVRFYRGVPVGGNRVLEDIPNDPANEGMDLGPGLYLTDDVDLAEYFSFRENRDDYSGVDEYIVSGKMFREDKVREGSKEIKDIVKALGKPYDKYRWESVFRAGSPYRELSFLAGSKVKLREVLESLGYQGIIGFPPSGTGTSAKQVVLFDPKAAVPTRRNVQELMTKGGISELPSILYQDENLPKGSMEVVRETGDILLRGLSAPDVSTGVHEIAHAARLMLLSRSQPPEFRSGITDEDIAVAEEWAGAENGVWSRAAEEKFARGWERYLRDGKAPVASLQGVFDKMAAWLRSIYVTVAGSPIDVEISDAMRTVFDKLVSRTLPQAAAPAPQPSPQATTPPPPPPPAPPTPPPSRETPEGDVTGVRNAVTDAMRAKVGMPPRAKEARLGNEEAWDKAIAILAADPEAGFKLVEAQKKSPTSIGPVETALYTHELLTREQAFDKALARYNANPTPETSEAFRLAGAAVTEAIITAERIGTIEGRALQARKILVYQDFTIGRALAMATAANGGKELSAAKTKELTDLHAEMEKLRIDLANAQEQLAKEQAEKIHVTVVADFKKEIRSATARGEKPLSAIERAADAARARMAARKKEGRLNSLPVDEFLDMSIIGVSYIAKGLNTIGSFTTQLVKDFGKKYLPFAGDIFAKSQELYAAAAPSSKVKSKEDILNKIDPEAPLNDRAIYQLVLHYINEGVDGFEAVMGAVKTDLQQFYPDLTLREVHDAYSRYGQTSVPDPAEDKKLAREYRELSLLMSKKEDAEKGLAPLKTGRQRDKATQQVRDLTKQVNDTMRRLNIRPTSDATQIRSSFEAIKTRLRNEYEDLDTAIKTREERKERTPQTFTPEEEAELKQLRQRRDDRKSDYDAMFGKKGPTDEQTLDRLESLLDRRIAEERKMLEEGILKRVREMQMGPWTPALKKRKELLDKLKADRRERQKEARPKTPELQKKYERDLASLERRIKEEEALLEAGLTARQKDIRMGRWTPEMAEMQARLDFMREQRRELAKSRRPEKDEAAADYEKATKAIEASVQRYKDIIAGIAKPAAAKKYSVDAEMRALMDQRDALKDAAAAIRDADPARQDKRKQDLLKTIQRSITEVTRKIQDGDLSTKPRTDPFANDPDVVKIRAARDMLNKTLAEMRRNELPKRSPEEIRESRDRAMLQNKIDKLEDRIARGDYSKRAKLPPPNYKERDALVRKAKELESKFNENLLQLTLDNREFSKVIFDNTMDVVFGVSRAMLTSFDAGAFGRQAGLVNLIRPGLAVKNFPANFAFSEKAATRYETKMESDPQWSRAQAAGLALTSWRPGSSLSDMEEVYRSRIAKKIPGVAASERAYVTYLNVTRFSYFNALMDTLPVAQQTEANMKFLARHVNMMTGRGNLKKFEGAAAALASVFFSPKYWWSRLQILGNMIYVPLDAMTGFRLGPAETRVARKIVAKEYARLGAMLGLVFGLFAFAKDAFDLDDEEFMIGADPRSSDFGKLRLGNTRIDFMAGLLQNVVFLSRIATGEKTTAGGEVTALSGPDAKFKETRLGETIRLLRTKLSPAAGSIANALDGADVVGNKFTWETEIVGSYIPMSVAETYSSMRELGVAPGAAAGLLGFIGIGASTYGGEEDYVIEQDIMTGVFGVDQSRYDAEVKEKGWKIPKSKGLPTF